ncbi:probable cytochrome P450 49a1 [Thrips palmi]|uniref:Probable cytochrome P450 49a1 n=1 Tax=Thrips palmi TaxID=161013 RepID=A0A6P8ZXZ4_THRPL|nr:probable cytochrome P450 49a1 [Thrips palmi]
MSLPRVQRAARCALRLQQERSALRAVAARARSTAAALAAEADWDAARPYSDIPGPKPLAVGGNAWRFMPYVGQFHGLGLDELIAALHAEFGPVCKLGGMPRPDLLFVSDVDIMQSVLRNEGSWPTRRAAQTLEHYFRDLRKNYLVSLAVSNGKEWQDFRSAVNQVMMQPRNTAPYVQPIDSVAQDFVARMREIRAPDGRMPADYTDELAKWSLESISYVALDTRLGLLAGDLDPTSDAVVMMDTIRGLFDCMYNLDIKPSVWKWVSTPTYRKFVGNMHLFTSLASKYVDRAVARLKALSRRELEQGNRSVLESLLINTGDPTKAVSMVMDMLLAGVDTTSAAMSGLLYQLATNPDKQAKLQEELDRVIPDKTAPITQDQMEQLKYARACIKEAMRLMPVLPTSFRDTGKDQVLGGYRVPKGTTVGMSSLVMAQDERYFPKARQFLPERWLPGGSKTDHPFAFLPFGFGPRMCVGKRFANLELENLVAKIFRNFTLEWNQPPARTKFTIFLKFETPLQFIVRDRP